MSKGFYWAIAAFQLFLLVLIFFSFKHDNKYVYIDTMQVYKEFRMAGQIQLMDKSNDRATFAKIEQLEMDLANVEKLLVDAHSSNKPSDALLQKRTQINSELEMLLLVVNNEETQSKEAANQRIWARINSEMKVYGDQNKYQMILGANGSGSLLYAKEGIDRTKDFIEFINVRYEN